MQLLPDFSRHPCFGSHAKIPDTNQDPGSLRPSEAAHLGTRNGFSKGRQTVALIMDAATGTADIPGVANAKFSSLKLLIYEPIFIVP